jgi:hypothetical protein
MHLARRGVGQSREGNPPIRYGVHVCFPEPVSRKFVDYRECVRTDRGQEMHSSAPAGNPNNLLNYNIFNATARCVCRRVSIGFFGNRQTRTTIATAHTQGYYPYLSGDAAGCRGSGVERRDRGKKLPPGDISY